MQTCTSDGKLGMPKTSKNIIANYIGTASTSIIQIIFIPVYIKYLGLEAYGLIGIYTSLMIWMSIADFGITPTLTREVASYLTGARSLQWINNLLFSVEIILSTIAILVILSGTLSSAWVSAHWFHAKDLSQDQIKLCLTYMTFSVAFKWYSNVYRGGVIGMQDQVWLNLANTVIIILKYAGVIPVLLFIKKDVQTFFLYSAIMALAELLVIRWRLKSKLKRSTFKVRFDTQALKRISRFASGIMIISIIGVVLSQSDKIILPKLIGLKSFGEYAFADTVASALLMVAVPIFTAIYPKLSGQIAASDLESQRTTYKKASELIFSFAIPAASGLIVFAQPLISLWTGNQVLTQDILPYFWILILANMLFSITHIPYALQLGYGWTGLSIRLNLGAIFIFLPALVILVPKYGVEAAAYAWLAVNLMFFFIQISLVNRRAGLIGPLTWFFRLFFPPACVCVGYFYIVDLFISKFAYHYPIWEVLEIAFICFIGFILTALSTELGRSTFRSIIRWLCTFHHGLDG